MCGIVGFLDKSGNELAPVGQVFLKMLIALGRRGPDSAGVALYGDCSNGRLILQGEEQEPSGCPGCLNGISRSPASRWGGEQARHRSAGWGCSGGYLTPPNGV